MKTTGLLLALAAALSAQQPQVENAKLQKVASSGPLAAQLAGFGAGPYWVGYSVPITPNRHNYWCGSNQYSEAPVRLEGQTSLVILVRMTNGNRDELRITSPDCRLDAGGLAFYWIENVSAVDSIAWLKTNPNDNTIMAIAQHAGPLADQALEELTSATQPDRIREKAAFWIGNSRGSHGVDVLNRMLASDSSQKVREQVVFALSQSKDPAGLTSLIQAARSAKDPRVRSRALFWLAQKASNQQSLDTIRNAVSADPEISVKEQAVFALKQLPNNQGTPALIEVAKTHRDPAVRKKAIFWLGQSNDPRALDFFAQVLKQ